ncbi:MAG: arsenic resistance protein [Nakamurella sp.]
MTTSPTVGFLERHQTAIYLLGLAGGALVGVAAPGASPGFGRMIEPVLALLLYATFRQVPFTEVTGALRGGRFLVALLLVNFVAAPIVVFGLARFVDGGLPVLIAVLLVLLTPCVDYVIVFSGLAGAASTRLLAATPLLMLGQMLLLPVYLLLLVGPELAGVFAPGPFIRAFVVLIVIPMTLAVLTELLAARRRVGGQITRGLTAMMVPLLAATLFVVAASQLPPVRDHLDAVVRVVPIYLAFALTMAGIGGLAARLVRLDPPAGRAVVFSGVTRNSLVVLPLALALPAGFEIAPAIVITQTLFELVVMGVLVRLVPRMLPTPH